MTGSAQRLEMAPFERQPKRKAMSREARYKKAKAAEAASRSKRSHGGKTSEGASNSTMQPQRATQKGKQKARDGADDDDDLEEGEKARPFRYKSFNDRLAAVHITLSHSLGRGGTGALAGLDGHGAVQVGAGPSTVASHAMDLDADNDDIEGDDDDGQLRSNASLHAKTSFGIALQTWRELNLSLPFASLLQRIQPLSQSLPLMLHNQEQVTRCLCDTLDATQSDSYLGYEPVLDLIPRMASDMGPAFLPSYPRLLAATLRVSTISKLNTEGEEYTAALIVERTFESLAATLRCLAPYILREQQSDQGAAEDWLVRTWVIIRPYLGWFDAETGVDQSAEVPVAAERSSDDGENGIDKSQLRVRSRDSRKTVPPHARRFASEALAHLIRRAKGDQLQEIASIMMRDATLLVQASQDNHKLNNRMLAFAAGVAGIWSEMAKSVDAHLHSRAISHLSAILLASVQAPTEATSHARIIVGSLIITALVHHGQAPTLLPLFEWLRSLVQARLEAAKLSDAALTEHMELLEAAEWLATFVGTRKGKRVDDAAKGPLFALLERVASSLRLNTGVADKPPMQEGGTKSSLVQLLALSLPIGRMQDLMCAGVKIINELRPTVAADSIPTAYSNVVLSLSKLEWSGFRQFVLPSALDVTSNALSRNGKDNSDDRSEVSALALLSALHEEGGHLQHVVRQTANPSTMRWINSLTQAVEAQITDLEHRERLLQPSEKDLITISLASLLYARAQTLYPLICKLISRLASVKMDDLRSAYDATPENPVELMSLALETLTSYVMSSDSNVSKGIAAYMTSNVNLAQQLLKLAWNRHLVVSVADFVSALHAKGLTCPLPELSQATEVLISSLTSSDESLRLAAARLLGVIEQDFTALDDAKPFAKLVEIEQTHMAIDTVRDRNVRTRAVVRDTLRCRAQSESEDDHNALDLAAHTLIKYLVSVMKLNFKPVWGEARKALVDMSSRYGQAVWQAAFQEMEGVSPLAAMPIAWQKQSEVTEVHNTSSELLRDASLCARLDKHFQDPQLVQRRDVIIRASQIGAQQNTGKRAADAQRVHGRLDVFNYQSQLLALFADIPSISERNNAPFMEYFFRTVVERESKPDSEDAAINGDDDALNVDESEAADDVDELNGRQSKTATVHSKTERRDQLCAYLETFSQFSNPRALYRSSDLHTYLYRLLSQGDAKVQRLALKVVLQWKDPAQVTYSSILNNLLDPSQFREQLTSLHLGIGAECTIQPAHREAFLPLLERILFGIATSKQNRSANQTSCKVSILTNLADLDAVELRELVNIMLEPFAVECGTYNENGVFFFTASPPSASHRKQTGFLSFLQDVIKHLALRIIPSWPALIATTLNITYHAAHGAESGHGKETASERSTRQSGLRRLNEFFLRPTTSFDWKPFLAPLFADLVSPRLPMLCTESIQSPSALLEILHTWSGASNLVFLLVDYDADLVKHVSTCLKAPTVKPSVINRVLDIIENIETFTHDEQSSDGVHQVQERILRPNMSSILSAIAPLVQRCNALTGPEAKSFGKDDMLRRLLTLLAKLSAHVSAASDVTSLLDLLSPLLSKSNAIIAEKSKTDVLAVFEQLLPSWLEAGPPSDVVSHQYDVLAGLFSKMRTRSSRIVLCRAFEHTAHTNGSLERVVKLVNDLNAFDRKRMQEFDFDRRLSAFDAINDRENKGEDVEGVTGFSTREWLPLLHNFVFFLQEPEEMAIRSSASTALRLFIDVVQQKHDTTDDTSSEWTRLFTSVVYSGLRYGLRSPSDLVKRETVETLGYAATKLTWIGYLAEMQGLLVEGDEEASFFNNVYHIQMHRRLRAITRLGQESQQGKLTTRTINDVFLPILEQLLRLDTNHGDGNLVGQAVECVGHLSSRLKWGPYNVLLWKYLSLTRSDSEDKKVSTKVCVRTSMSILDNFHFDMDEDLLAASDPVDTEQTVERAEEEAEAVRNAEDERTEALEHSRKVLGAVRHRLLPKLMEYLDLKDEMEDTVRLPIAVGVARVLLRLPVQHRRIEVVRLLTVLANVFRSKAQDTRDLARVTLAKVATTIGPDYFADLVAQLRKVLTRGPQVAVLSFTVHNVLLHCMEQATGKESLTILNEGTRDVVDVAIEDIFGHTAEDRQSIENRTTYREVKASKSLDTFEHVARIVHPTRISTILQPLRGLMSQTEAMQAVKSFDDCLRRIATGLQANLHLDSHEYLVLCHSLLTSNAAFLQQRGKVTGKGARKANAVLTKRADVEQGGPKDYYAHNAHRFVAFGLDLFFSALRKGKFDFSDKELLGKLEPLVTVIGNCLFARQTSIITIAMRALALLVKAPLDNVKAALPVITKQSLKILSQEGNAQTDVAMASLKLLAVTIRDSKVTEARPTDQQLSLLCRYVETNLNDNLEVQGTLFNLMRALIARKFIVSEVYDVMDKIATMLVVQQSASVRSTCRATYLDFLLELPQGNKRFANQMHFLAKNLDYVFESGRLSVLEFLRALFDKVNEDVLRPFIDLFFVALVMRLANDDSAACRERAASLITRITSICHEEERAKILQLTQSWSQASIDEGDSGRNLVRIAMMVYCIMADATRIEDAGDTGWIRRALSHATALLQNFAQELAENEIDLSVDDDSPDGLDWQLQYQTLQLVTRLYKRRDKLWSSMAGDGSVADKAFAPVWAPVQGLVLFPHAWVRLSASRLLGEHLSHLPVEAPDVPVPGVQNTRSLPVMVDLAKKLSLVLRSSHLEEALALQAVKNLVFVGKCFAKADEMVVREPRLTEGGNGAADNTGDGDEESSSESDSDDGADGTARQDELWKTEPLRWLFIRLSHQLRRIAGEQAFLSPSASTASISILKWKAAMMSQVGASQSVRYLVHVVAPLYRILESSSEASGARYGRTPEMADAAARRTSLEALASEVQDLVQAQLGTSAYASAYAQTKRRALDRRRERRATNLQRAIEFPEAALARKAVRNQRKHDSRKRKHGAFAKGKERVRPAKRQR